MAKKTNFEIKENDKGWKRIKKELMGSSSSYVKVGVQAGAMHDPEEKGQKAVEMSTIAVANEYGTTDGRIPERSFMRSTVTEQLVSIRSAKESILNKIYKGTFTFENGLRLIGMSLEKAIKDKIDAIKTPPNAPSTIKAKSTSSGRGDKPLIDTGQLKNSITSVLVK